MRPDPNLPPFFDPTQASLLFRPGPNAQASFLFSTRPKPPSSFRLDPNLPPFFESTQTSPSLRFLTGTDFSWLLIRTNKSEIWKKKQQENQNKNKEVSFYWATLIRYRSCISCYKISDSFLLSNPRKLGHPLWGRFLLSPRLESWCSVGTDRSHDSFGISRDITMDMYGILPRRDDVWVIHLPFPG